MKPAQFHPGHLEGRPFKLVDLRSVLAWAARRPTVRLHIMLDHADIPEVVEIYPPNFMSPRWLIWNTCEGGVRVDDLSKLEFELQYLTVVTALNFIDSELQFPNGSCF